MVGRGAGCAQDAPAPAGVGHSPVHGFAERLGCDVVRARGDEQVTARRHQRGGEPGELAVPPQARFDLLAALHERRRVGGHDLEGLAGLGEALHLGERVGAHKAAAHAVERCGPLAERERRLGTVDRHHLPGAGRRRADREAPGVAVEVEHAAAGRETRDEGAVLALVEVPAGLLALDRIGEEAQRALAQLDGAVERAAGDLDAPVEPFERAHRAVGPEHDRARGEDRAERIEQYRHQRVHARSVELADEDVAETVDRETRQRVGLGVDQPVERRIVQPVAERRGGLDAAGEKAAVDRLIRVAGQHARGDQRMRVERRAAECLAAGVDHANDASRRQRLGLRVHADFIRVRPWVAATHALRVGPQEMDRRPGRHGRRVYAWATRGQAR